MEPVALVSPILVSVFHPSERYLSSQKQVWVQYFVVKIECCLRERVVRMLFSRLQTLVETTLLWRKPLWGPNIGFICPKFLYLLETEDRVLGWGQHRSSTWMDQIWAGIPRAGECPRLRPEVCPRLQQGLPDGGAGLHHEASPLWGKAQEIFQVRVEFTVSHSKPFLIKLKSRLKSRLGLVVDSIASPPTPPPPLTTHTVLVIGKTPSMFYIKLLKGENCLCTTPLNVQY